jgi:outer membrane lipoprotein LolB
MKPAGRWLARLLILLVAVVAGCASPTRVHEPANAANGPWSGRLALQVEDDPSQSFSAGFELSGNAQAGELALFTPLGGTLALLAWSPGSATLRSNGQTRGSDSVDTLVNQATGTAIPVAVLFDWLQGFDSAAAGWQADLSQLAQGRLRAKRMQPPPAVDLRVVLDQ